MELKFKKTHPEATTPRYATPGSACFDLHAVGPDDRFLDTQVISERNPISVDTGLAFEVPEGYVMLVFSRSGHGFKHDTRLANCVGVVDSDYRGSVQIRLTRDKSWSTHPLRVRHGDRIAQAMIVPIPAVTLTQVDELSTTERGAGGFGSTGS